MNRTRPCLLSYIVHRFLACVGRSKPPFPRGWIPCPLSLAYDPLPLLMWVTLGPTPLYSLCDAVGNFSLVFGRKFFNSLSDM